MDDPSDRLLPTFWAESACIDPLILFGLKVGFGNVKAIFRLANQGSGEPEPAMFALLENVGHLLDSKDTPSLPAKRLRS